jgi:hypothetical protein
MKESSRKRVTQIILRVLSKPQYFKAGHTATCNETKGFYWPRAGETCTKSNIERHDRYNIEM